MDSGEPLIRIGELSRRLGVSVDRLRAWERRYQLLEPMRTAGGFRLYSRADELRGRAMQDQLAAGLSAAEAARAILAADASRPRRSRPVAHLSRNRARLTESTLSSPTRCRPLLAERRRPRHPRFISVLHDLGDAWLAPTRRSQSTSPALKHICSPAARSAPRARTDRLPPVRRRTHTLARLVGIALRNRGWRSSTSGRTPLASIHRAPRLSPRLVVLSAPCPHTSPPPPPPPHQGRGPTSHDRRSPWRAPNQPLLATDESRALEPTRNRAESVARSSPPPHDTARHSRLDAPPGLADHVARLRPLRRVAFSRRTLRRYWHSDSPLVVSLCLVPSRCLIASHTPFSCCRTWAGVFRRYSRALTL